MEEEFDEEDEFLDADIFFDEEEFFKDDTFIQEEYSQSEDIPEEEEDKISREEEFPKSQETVATEEDEKEETEIFPSESEKPSEHEMEKEEIKHRKPTEDEEKSSFIEAAEEVEDIEEEEQVVHVEEDYKDLKEEDKEVSGIVPIEEHKIPSSVHESAPSSSSSSSIQLNATELEEINRSKNPSYEKIPVPYSLICEKRVTSRMRQIQKLLKKEIAEIAREQISAFESVRIRRLYKTGIYIPERLFQEHEKGFTFREVERLRHIMNNDIF